MNHCFLKHLGAAYVLFQESLEGYAWHKVLALGHLNEASREGPVAFRQNICEIRHLSAIEAVAAIKRLLEIIYVSPQSGQDIL